MKRNKLLLKYISSILYLFLFSYQGNAQSISTTPTLFQKLESYTKLVIQTDLDSMFLNKRLEEYQPATIYLYGDNQPRLKFKTKIKARGKFRRVKCEIPPLKINFSKSELAELGLNKKFDKFKLVSHCLLDGSANSSVLKEYSIYKMHNYISAYSFKVKSFTIIYQDNKKLSRTIRGEGFLLEPNKEMAFRNGGKLIDKLGTEASELTPESYHHLIMFNYMIGNTDWNISQQKNLKFLRKEGVDKLIVIPYDFDNCKLVDPPYMSSYPDTETARRDNRHVKEKFHSKEALYQEIEFFQALKSHYLFICDESEGLYSVEKKRMKIYLKPFFKGLKKKDRMARMFLDEK